MDCAGKIVAQEGPQALFKGLGPALLRAFPVNFLILFTVVLKDFLKMHILF
jgi:hypothetical protein